MYKPLIEAAQQGRIFSIFKCVTAFCLHLVGMRTVYAYVLCLGNDIHIFHCIEYV